MQDNKTRQYPEINFIETDTEKLMNSLIQSYEIITERKLYPADPTRLFILWIADILTQERVIINQSARQNVPRYAEGEYLDSLAEIFKDTERLPSSPAVTTIRFYISAPQPSAQTIPKGTRITVDGEITFETTETITIQAGSLYGDAAAACQTMGENGNGFIPGQIAQIVDLYPFYERVENITTSEGGTDVETDAHFYERLRDSMETFSTAGPLGAYIYWAKTASVKITDVKPSTPEPGVADIRILLENGEMPDEEMIQLVLDKLTGGKDGVRPFTDFVQVSAPDKTMFDIDVTYYIPKPRENSATSIQEEAKKALAAFKKWQTEKMGRDINPSKLGELLMGAGLKRVEIRSPAYGNVLDNAVAVIRSENFAYGGVEDE